MRKRDIFGAVIISAFIGISILFSTDAFGLTIDGAVTYATDPYSGSSTGFGSTVGYGIGVITPMRDISERASLAARFDLNYYKWSRSDRYLESSFERLPVFAGFRLYRKAGPMRLYGEAGLELSFDTWESSYTGPLYGTLSPGQKSSYSDRYLGLAPGAGIEFSVGAHFLIGFLARYHLIENPYSTFGISIGYRF